MIARSLASIFPRQSPSSVILSSINAEADSGATVFFDISFLPDLVRSFDRPGKASLSNVLDCREAAWGNAAPFESSGRRRPMKQRDLPGMGDAATLVVHEAVILRASGCHESADRQLTADDISGLILGSRLR